MIKSKKKKSKKKIGKPPALIYSVAFFFVNIVYRIKYRISIDRSGLKGIKGPALVIAPHVSGKDHILTGLALFPQRPTYVLSHHFNTNKVLRPVLKMMKTIEKRMFCPDGGSVLNIIRAVREGNVVLLFPEGRLTWYGRSLSVAEGTADLVKKLGVNVYTVTSNGAGLTWPKWAKERRRGKIEIKTAHILTPDEIKERSVQEIGEVISASILHDEEKALPSADFSAKHPSLGLDGIVWKCPECGEEDCIECRDDRAKCRKCGREVTVDGKGVISGFDEKCGIDTVADWYEYCAGSVDITNPLTSECELDTEDENGNMVKAAGNGRISIDGEKFSFEGKLNGNDLSFDISLSVMKAFPLSVADHFDAYYENRLYLFRPTPDPRKAVKFVAYLDKVTASKKND